MYYTFGRRSFQKADHPRGCGEHLYSSSFLPYLKGIIPADAGNTSGRCGRRSWAGDHPRGCGEHVSFATCDGLCVGSSPRMRGTHLEILHLMGALSERLYSCSHSLVTGPIRVLPLPSGLAMSMRICWPFLAVQKVNSTLVATPHSPLLLRAIREISPALP